MTHRRRALGLVPSLLSALLTLSTLVALSGCAEGEVQRPGPPNTPYDYSPTPGGRWLPRQGSTFHIQYAGNVDLNHAVEVYNLDWEQTTADQVQALKNRGVHVICYVNAGASEDWRSDHKQFPKGVMGEPLDGWPGEHWLDVRQRDVLVPLMAARMDVCKQKGFDAIDPDNTDGYTQKSGFDLTAEDQISYQKSLAEQAHRRGLSIGLKNDADQLPQLGGIVDFAVNEECVGYHECDTYQEFLKSGKAVFNIEYKGKLDKICPGRPAGMSTVLADRQLSGALQACP